MEEKVLKRHCKICSTEYSIGHKSVCASDDCWNEYLYRIECNKKKLFTPINTKPFVISEFPPAIIKNILTDGTDKE